MSTHHLDGNLPVFELMLESGEYSIYDLLYELEPNTDNQGREYEMVGQFLENNDFYQGLNMVTVIRRKSDSKLFGYSWWNDISKYGEPYMDSNGDRFGLENDTSADDYDWNTFVSFFVFEPVEEYSIKAFRFGKEN